jgi:hypothetical protein
VVYYSASLCLPKFGLNNRLIFAEEKDRYVLRHEQSMARTAIFSFITMTAMSTVAVAQNVTTTPGPGVNQNITQQVGTQLGTNNFKGIRYATNATVSVDASSYNFSQASTSTNCTGSGATCTATLAAGILGLYGTDVTSGVTVSGSGNTEYVQLLGNGGYTPSAGGTIQFATTHAYTNPTISSASSGIQEAINDACGAASSGTCKANISIACSPSSPPATAYYQINYPVTILDGVGGFACDGAMIDVEVWRAVGAPVSTGVANSNTGAAFSFNINSAEVDFHGFRVTTQSALRTATITNTSCSANVATITSTLNPPVGSVVTIQWTDAPFYWGKYVVASTSSSNFTFSKATNGNTISCTSIASASTPGGVAIANDFAEDNGQDIHIHDIHYDMSTAIDQNDYPLTALVTTDDDEAYWYDHIEASGGPTSYCTSTFCPVIFNMPGGANNLPIGVLDHLNLSLSCGANGIFGDSGQGMTIEHAIIQGFPQFGIVGGTLRGSSGQVITNDVYEEVDCQNPLYTAAGLSGANATSAAAGINLLQGVVNMKSDMATNAPSIAGTQPLFCTGGSQTYTLRLVIFDGANESLPLIFGTATPATSTTACTVAFPRYATQTGSTVTYQVLVTPGLIGSDAAPYGTGNFAVSSSPIAQCSGLICTLSVSNWASSGLNSFTVLTLPTLTPTLYNWPGGVVLGNAGVLVTDAEASPQGGVIATSNAAGSVVTPLAGSPSAGVAAESLFFTPTNPTNTNALGPATLIESGSGADSGNDPGFNGIAKGRFNFGYRLADGRWCPMDLITLVDSNFSKTIADAAHRPLADAADTAISLDIAGCSTNAANMQLAIRAPIAISQYIGTIADNVSYLERLTSSGKTFNTPVTFKQGGTSLVPIVGSGPFNPTGTQVSDNFVRANSSSLGSNWTCNIGSFGINNDTAVITAENSSSQAECYYSASSFAADQFVQVTITPANNYIGACVRVGTGTSLSGYCVISGSTATYINKYVSGTGTQLYSGASQLAAGTIANLSVVGSTITLTENSGSGPVQVFSGTDTSLTSGSPGVLGLNTITNSAYLQNFYGGNATFATNDNVAFGGKINQVVKGSFAGTCVFSSGTTCNVTYGTAYNSTPLVFLQPVNPGSTTFKLTSTSASGFTITASASNSDTVNWLAIGNPN